ncbi:hypothetical protein [Lactococcus lactis]|uniref:hypothetical protein n=1 Tax=Lactococcus lactis TaxID=1358 RepID=UPI000536EA1C|nr:hypothetical protein [Lactococcus lactis]KHE76053.1 hypothetical protein N489_11415 [Lactococcus lactis subsp. lactis 1AA59]KSU16740.1 hypothetical protein LMG14418_1954 [Lactococcus lactis subsp. lactis]MBG1278514.1 hypothetical protein [Lactococcus lactis subsp. lactis]MCX7531070.1 hypothetical protein [Lactococcus lactis]MDM7473510.1 hypothetical protein [Lactococcus lactis]
MFEELEIHIEEIEMYIQNIYKAVNDYASGTYKSLELDDKGTLFITKGNAQDLSDYISDYLMTIANIIGVSIIE